MSKAEKIRRQYGDRIRESLGAGEGTKPTLVEHPTRNKRFESAKKAKGYFEIKLSEIEADPQHREIFEQEDIEKLAASLIADGLISPIVVRWDQNRCKYVIIAGERRYRAARLTGWERITCDVKPDGITEGEIAELQLAENHARKDLNPIELAAAFQDVINKNGYTIRDVAKRVGVNETTVTRYVRLLALPEDIKKQIANGKIQVGVAREAARLKTENEQRAFISTALNKELSAAEAQKAASSKKAPRKRKSKSKKRLVKSFETDFGEVEVRIKPTSNISYQHFIEALEQATEESKLRLRNRIRP